MSARIASWIDTVEPVSHPLQDAESSESEPAHEDMEVLVTGFRRSDFLKFLVRHMKAMQRDAEKEAARLRNELSQCRAAGLQAVGNGPPGGVLDTQDKGELEMITREQVNEIRQEKLIGRLRAENQKLRSSLALKSMHHTGSVAFAEDDSETNQNGCGKPPRISETSDHVSEDGRGVGESHQETSIQPISDDVVKQTSSAWDEVKDPSNAKKFDPKMSRSGTLVRFSQRFRPAQKHCFSDVEDMKAKVRLAIMTTPYNVQDLYNEDGVFQAIARRQEFEYATLCIIALNAVWIAIDADHNDSAYLPEAPPIFQFAEHFFCTYFVIEWFIRFMAFKRTRDAINDFWFLFDTVLVCLMIFETWIMLVAMSMFTSLRTTMLKSGDTTILKLFRMTRLTRMARMAKLLRAMPELTILIKGMWVAARSVFFTLVLLTILIYIFAVAFKQLTDGNVIGQRYFKTVPYAMRTLLLEGTLPDLAEFVRAISDEHFMLGIISLLFILLGTLTVMNMLVGVLVEVVSVVSAVEKEELKVNFVKTKLLHMLNISGLDADEDTMISKDEFESLLVNPEAAKTIRDVGVDPVGLVDFVDVIFGDSKRQGLSFPHFIEVVLQFRGSNNATVRDVVDLRKVTLKNQTTMQQQLMVQGQQLNKILSLCRLNAATTQTSKEALKNCEGNLRMTAVAFADDDIRHQSEDNHHAPNPPTSGGYPSPPPYTPPSELPIGSASLMQ